MTTPVPARSVELEGAHGRNGFGKRSVAVTLTTASAGVPGRDGGAAARTVRGSASTAQKPSRSRVLTVDNPRSGPRVGWDRLRPIRERFRIVRSHMVQAS